MGTYGAAGPLPEEEEDEGAEEDADDEAVYPVLPFPELV